MERLHSKAEELEEDIWRLQADKENLLKSITEKDAIILEKEDKIEELNSSVTKQDLTLKKMKIQFQAKLKALKEKQPESQSQSPNDVSFKELLITTQGYLANTFVLICLQMVNITDERAKELENRIAELEGERGNIHLFIFWTTASNCR